MTTQPPVFTPPPPNFVPQKQQNKLIVFILSHKLLVTCICAVFLMLISMSRCSTVTSELKAKALRADQLSTELASNKSAISTFEANSSEVKQILSSTPKVIFVTATLTSTPLYTPTITMTPTITLTPTATLRPTATPDPLKMPVEDGIYLIGVDIAPGVWLSNGSGDGCYWEVSSKTGNIIDNHFGMAGGTAYLSPNAFSVTFEDCGMWTFYAEP